MKIKYYTNWSVFKPVKCIGVLKVVFKKNPKETKSIYDAVEAGYYRSQGKWIRDDMSVIDGAFGENMDWFEADEKEAKRAIKELDDSYRRRHEMVTDWKKRGKVK